VTNQTIVITGASSGIGEEMARQFASRGYDLALCARRLDRLEALKTELAALHPGSRFETAVLDVTDDDAVAATLRRMRDTFRTIDRVIINAGVGSGAALGTGRHEANRALALTNFVGALATADYAMEIFREQQSGHLVIMSSISAVRGLRRSLTTYAATKAGVAALGEGLRAENIPGVDISVIFPGYILSEMTAAAVDRTKFMVDTATGVSAIVEAIEKRRIKAYVPRWPKLPIAVAATHLPLPLVTRLLS
jgi:short-subunit dehydrogenase